MISVRPNSIYTTHDAIVYSFHSHQFEQTHIFNFKGKIPEEKGDKSLALESKIKYSKGTDFSSRIEKWIAFEDVIKEDILSSVLDR